MDEHALRRAAKTLNDIFYIDSAITLPLEEIVRAIRADGVIPSCEDLEDLAMGDDTGEVPQELREKYRHLDTLITLQFL